MKSNQKHETDNQKYEKIVNQVFPLPVFCTVSIADNNLNNTITKGSITVTEMVEVLGTLYCMGGCEKVL